MRAVELVDAFIKAAQTALPRAPRLSDPGVKSGLPKYTAPNQAAETTRPETVAPQKTINPPPVL
jgi:hypothetical protein